MRPTHAFRLLAVQALVWLGSCGPSTPTTAFLWKIERDPPAYLFGTIHVADPRVTTLHPRVARAIDDSDHVYGELDLTSETKRAYQSRIMRTDGKTLEQVLSDEAFERFARFVRDRGYAMQLFQPMKTWVAATTLLVLDGADEAWAGRPALDEVVLGRAREAGKKVGGLETVDEQLDVFESLTAAEQETLLSGTIDLLEQLRAEGRDYIAEMVDSYLTGDGDVILALTEETTGLERDPELEAKFLALLLTDRNVRMAQRIEDELKERKSESFFFAVGTLHLPGTEGICELLRAKGWVVERLAPPR